MNEAPMASADTLYARAGTEAALDVLANDTDPEGDIDPWSVAVMVPAALGTAAPDSTTPGTMTYTTTAAGIDVTIYEVCDRFLQCATAELVTAVLADH